MNQEGERSKKGKFSRKTILIAVVVLAVIAVAAGAGLITASQNPSFCVACHIMEPYYQSWENSNLLAYGHAADEEHVECLECHHQSYPEKAQEGIKFITGNYDDPLKERDFSREQCLECHGDDFDQVIAKTDFGDSNPHDAHFVDLECNLCHKMHRKSEVYCAECHQFEWMNDLDNERWNI